MFWPVPCVRHSLGKAKPNFWPKATLNKGTFLAFPKALSCVLTDWSRVFLRRFCFRSFWHVPQPWGPQKSKPNIQTYSIMHFIVYFLKSVMSYLAGKYVAYRQRETKPLAYHGSNFSVFVEKIGWRVASPQMRKTYHHSWPRGLYVHYSLLVGRIWNFINNTKTNKLFLLIFGYHARCFMTGFGLAVPPVSLDVCWNVRRVWLIIVHFNVRWNSYKPTVLRLTTGARNRKICE